jgi:hypothetical protein
MSMSCQSAPRVLTLIHSRTLKYSETSNYRVGIALEFRSLELIWHLFDSWRLPLAQRLSMFFTPVWLNIEDGALLRRAKLRRIGKHTISSRRHGILEHLLDAKISSHTDIVSCLSAPACRTTSHTYHKIIADTCAQNMNTLVQPVMADAWRMLPCPACVVDP